MTTICLQAGHEHIQQNCFADMHGSTGASGEIAWTPIIRGKVAARLRAHGFAVTEVDANVNCAATHPRYDLTLALHYQSWDGKPGEHGGFGVFVPDASVDRDLPTSIKLGRIIRLIYKARTGLPDYSDLRLKDAAEQSPSTWANPNTTLYYVWRTQNGPLALIECGVGAPGAPQYDLLHNHTDTVADYIAEGVCAAFGVKWVVAPPPVIAPPVEVTFPPVEGKPLPDPNENQPSLPPLVPAEMSPETPRGLQDILVALLRWVRNWGKPRGGTG